MNKLKRFENAVLIQAAATTVERCLTEQELMHRWLNPALRCEAVGEWSTEPGSEMRFVIQIPLLSPTLLPTLMSRVIEREPGLIIWSFDGFFRGRDRWECQPQARGTRLINCFEFEIPNPVVQFGFNRFASRWTQADMQTQLVRLKQVAERL